MRKGNGLLRFCGRIMSIVILLSFLKYPVYGGQQTMQPMSLNEDGTRLYTDSEVDLLIDDLSAIALEAIEKAAAEAAKAAALAGVEREAAALHEAHRWRLEAEANLQVIRQTRRAGVRNAVVAGLVGLLGGLVTGFVIRR